MTRVAEARRNVQEEAQEVLKILHRLTWLNSCLSSLSMASGIWSVATLSTFIGHSVSIPFGAISLAGVSISSMAMMLTKRYQKKLVKVMKLVNTMMLALSVFEMSVSEELNDGRVDEYEFNMLQMFHLGALNKLANVDHKMKTETKVCSLLEWCFINSVGVSGDHSQLRYTGFAGSH